MGLMEIQTRRSLFFKEVVVGIKTLNEIKIKKRPGERNAGYEVVEKIPMIVSLVITGAMVRKRPRVSLRCLFIKENNCPKCLVGVYHPPCSPQRAARGDPCLWLLHPEVNAKRRNEESLGDEAPSFCDKLTVRGICSAGRASGRLIARLF